MTRDLDWGIPVPVEGAEGKVLYVWFDAPIGYISATREYFAEKGEPEAWKTWWQDPSSSLVHFIGKDNIVFHTIIFPMILNEHGDYNLPDQVPANEFLNLEGDKLSTSRNWAIWLHEYLQEFPGKQDELRYTLTSIAPETKDSDFTWKDYQGRVNSELVAILGNFVNRVMVLTHKYFEGLVPGNKLRPDTSERAAVMDAIRASVEEIEGYQSEMIQSLTDFRFREAQATMMSIARAGNRFLAETEPWKLYKTDAAAVAVILDHALQICAQLALACEPFLPYTSGRLLEQLQWEPDTQVRRQWWREQQSVKPLEAGHQLGQPELLFRNVEDEMMEAQRAKLVKTPEIMETPSPTHTPLKPEIAYEDFAKLDLRVGEVLAAEKVAGADKLLQLTIDLGFEQRTVVSGIAMHFTPDEIIGGKVTLLANLAPRKLRGILSQGMILMAENKDGKLLFVAPNASANNGGTIS
jgi:methionyl-tRNA synthetase